MLHFCWKKKNEKKRGDWIKIFSISMTEEDGEDDEEVASNRQQACHHVGEHVANHHLQIETCGQSLPGNCILCKLLV